MRNVVLIIVAVIIIGLFALGIARELQIAQDLALSYESLDRVIAGQPGIAST